MTKEPLRQKQKQSVIRSTLSMAVGTFSSRILGYLRDAIMYALFPRSVTDAWVVAWRLPNVFRRLLGEGALSPSFIPVYVQARARSEVESQRLSSAVFSVAFALSTVLSVAAFVYMPAIIWFLIGGSHSTSASPLPIDQTVYLARIMIFYLILVSTYAFHAAVANTHGHFFIPSLGPTLFNAGLILFTISQRKLGPYAGTTQSWGVLFGGSLQVGVVAWLLWREGYLPNFTWQWRVPGVAAVFANLLPGLFGLGIFQIITVVNTKFASALGEGAQSYIYAADRIVELPQSLIAVSLGAALLPRFSELHAGPDRQKFLGEATQAVRMLLYLSLPAAIGMYFLALAVTQVLYMRGAFANDDAFRVAEVVRMYAGLMLFMSLARVLAPAFFALKHTWLPAGVALVALTFHLIIGPIFVRRSGLAGLATATTLTSILNLLLLQVFFHFWVGKLAYAELLRSLWQILPGLLALAAICQFAFSPLVDLSSQFLSASQARTSALALVIACGMLVYFYLTAICGSPEAQRIVATLESRFRR